jgi:hypothetical protein
LFKSTHSDEGFKIFKPSTYHKLKWEGHYKEVCLEAGGSLPFKDSPEYKKGEESKKEQSSFAKPKSSDSSEPEAEKLKELKFFKTYFEEQGH